MNEFFILKIVGTLLTLGTGVFFVLWAVQMAISLQADGAKLAATLNISSVSFWDPAQGPNLLEQAAIAVLPLVELCERNGILGVDHQLAQTEEGLIRAGLRGRLAPYQFVAWCWTTGLVAGFAAFLLVTFFGSGFIFALLFVFPLASIVGAVIPQLMLRSYIADRISLVEKRLPFAIEFVVMAMEADPSLEGAIKTYSSQIPSDPFGVELLQVAQDIRFGMRQQDALLNMATRLQSGPISSFVLAVNTGLSTGQGVKEALQMQANVTREKRFQAAEEIAKAASTKATIPLVIAALAIILLLVGPMIIKLSENSLF